MFAKETMELGTIAKKGEAASVAERNGESGVDERLPVIGVVHDVAHRAFACHIRHPPVVADAITRPALVLRKRLTRRTDEPSVARHDHSRVS